MSGLPHPGGGDELFDAMQEILKSDAYLSMRGKAIGADVATSELFDAAFTEGYRRTRYFANSRLREDVAGSGRDRRPGPRARVGEKDLEEP